MWPFCPKPKPQKWSVHRFVRPVKSRAPTQSLITFAVKQFERLHPNARVEAITHLLVGVRECYIWVFYTE